ncbi:hypothetical protein D3C85_1209140 [compost metagenome]
MLLGWVADEILQLRENRLIGFKIEAGALVNRRDEAVIIDLSAPIDPLSGNSLELNLQFGRCNHRGCSEFGGFAGALFERPNAHCGVYQI